MSPAGINGGYYTGALPVQQAHSTTPHEAPHSVAQTPAAPTPQPAAPAVAVLPHTLVSTAAAAAVAVVASSITTNGKAPDVERQQQ